MGQRLIMEDFDDSLIDFLNKKYIGKYCHFDRSKFSLDGRVFEARILGFKYYEYDYCRRIDMAIEDLNSAQYRCKRDSIEDVMGGNKMERLFIFDSLEELRGINAKSFIEKRIQCEENADYIKKLKAWAEEKKNEKPSPGYEDWWFDKHRKFM